MDGVQRPHKESSEVGIGVLSALYVVQSVNERQWPEPAYYSGTVSATSTYSTVSALRESSRLCAFRAMEILGFCLAVCTRSTHEIVNNIQGKGLHISAYDRTCH